MIRPLFIGIIVSILASSAAAGIDFVRQISIDFSSRDMKRIERTLSREFPMSILRKRAKGIGKPIVSRVTYFPLRQRSRLYVLAVANAKWSDYASRFAIYRIYSDSIVRIYTSRSWQANYPVYGFNHVAAGKEQFILFTEGTGDHDRHELASVFTFGYYKARAFINNLTPKMPGVSAQVEFPFTRPLYAKGITLQAHTTAELSASDKFTPAIQWNYDKIKRKFVVRLTPAMSTSLDH